MDAVTQAIKELSLARPDNRKRDFPLGSNESAARSFDLEEPGEIREPESSSASQVRGGDTFTVSIFEQNRRKGLSFLPLRGAK